MVKNKNLVSNNKFDYIVIAIFLFSLIVPVMIATSQYYITQYGDDIAMISWAQEHHTNPLDIFTGKLGTGYRPMMHVWFFAGYNLWGGEPFYYHMLNGIIFASAMVFLYLLGKTLNGKVAGITAVLLYLFLDGSFIMVAKLGFIAFSAEILFITAALYFAIQFYKTNNKTSMWLAIIISALAFLSKETSLLIIPLANLTYLYFNNSLKRIHIILCMIPIVYMFVILLYLAPDVGAEQGSNLIERITSNLQFYINTELFSQFKTPFLLILSLMISGYYWIKNKFRTEISMCIMWFVVGILPFLITQQPVQPTYLIESNLAAVLLIGVICSDRFKINDLLTGILILAIISQAIMIPIQIAGIKGYNQAVSLNQKTFFETVNELDTIPSNSTVFYLSDETRQQYGYQQLTTYFFQKYLCIRNFCDINVTNSYNETNYIILPSSADIQVFGKEHPNQNIIILSQIQNGENYGYVLQRT